MLPYSIDRLSAPLLVTWQLTRDCDLCCVHCCTDSAPGKRLPDELDADEALALAGRLIDHAVPYVMLCGGEPLVVPHFFNVAETLGRAGVYLKIETNGQRFTPEVAERLAHLPVRSIQISLDADSEEIYGRQRPGGSLAKAHDACRAARAAGLPLEVTFAPTRLNIAEIEAVIRRARELGAFRLNTGQLMRIGTAARLWDRVEPTPEQYARFRAILDREARIEGAMELCYSPFTLSDALRRTVDDPPPTLLVLPDGRVKVAAALPYICASVREQSMDEVWRAYRDAWRDPAVLAAVRHAADDEPSHARANRWKSLPVVSA